MADAPLSQRAYARLRGCAVNAVQKAIRDGRLRESVVLVDGTAKIVDRELADREWDKNTRQRADARRPTHPGPVPAPGQAVTVVTIPPPPDPSAGWIFVPAGVPAFNVSRDLRAAAAARREAAAADLAELELGERRGRLVDADRARADVFARISMAKARLLGVPALVGQDAPDVAARVVPLIERRIREAIEELSDDGRVA